jgi:hypothetical protein
MDEMRFYTVVLQALSTERQQKLEVATKLHREKTEAVIVYVSAKGSNWIPFSLLSKETNVS